jgi:exodeoxyribonuclease III
VRIATWNVNSIRARMPRVEAWLDAWRPDLLCLQETKVVDADFPVEPFRTRGYQVECFGQKTYNGVALIARAELGELRDVVHGMPDDPPEADRRLIAATLSGVRVIDVYVPNGTEVGSERFAYKLAWFGRLRAMLAAAHQPADSIIVCGDFNVAPEERDVHDPELWRGQLLFHPDERAALRDLATWGLIDAFRLHEQGGGHYSWWDYRAGAFHKGHGLRIDLILVTESLARRCRRVVIDREARKGAQPSDHAPVVIDLD